MHTKDGLKQQKYVLSPIKPFWKWLVWHKVIVKLKTKRLEQLWKSEKLITQGIETIQDKTAPFDVAENRKLYCF